MLPVPAYKPTGSTKLLIRIRIPRPILINLILPPITIMGGDIPVIRTSMPETAINEDGYFLAGECDINGAPWCTWDWILHPITQAISEK
jgi:hypothetical protein